jgi:hypothetical protein
MHQLIYISTARLADADRDVGQILLASRRNNMRDGITGLLVFDGKRFLQVLEGPRRLVEATLARIKADTRHRAPVILSAREIEQAEFGNWNMSWERVPSATSAATMQEGVDAMVAGVANPNTRALFSSFVRIDRSKAA